ncbi:unnamed protein product [Linum trigynum]|uniref:Secreted protein n=1 Tax=Linum trigynum TaxID=586398 RepID=A0AAV2EBA5_9ROSI
MKIGCVARYKGGHTGTLTNHMAVQLIFLAVCVLPRANTACPDKSHGRVTKCSGRVTFAVSRHGQMEIKHGRAILAV